MGNIHIQWVHAILQAVIGYQLALSIAYRIVYKNNTVRFWKHQSSISESKIDLIE